MPVRWVTSSDVRDRRDERELGAGCGEVGGVETNCDDARLIVASLAEPVQFAEIFDRHASELLGYLARRVGTTEAEALLGQLFRTAFETRRNYDPSRTDARPWLYGIATNLVMKHYRTAGRHRAAMERLMHRREILAEPFDQRIADEAAAAQLWSVITEAINGLPERDREVLLLFAWQGLDYAEIAEAMGIPVGTVRSRLNRVRAKLRELRDINGKEPDDTTERTQRGAAT